MAYLTAQDCGRGHAMRGTALVAAGGRIGIDVRAFGPGLRPLSEVEAFAPDLVLGDVAWRLLDPWIARLHVPGWLLMRWNPAWWMTGASVWWERRFSIERISDDMPTITDRLEPIVMDPPAFTPVAGQLLRAGYNAWWEATWFGYRDRVRWFTDGSPERQARIDAGGEMHRNGGDELMEMIS